MQLDLSSLKKALSSMDRAWNYSHKRLESGNLEQDEIEVLRAAVNQNFEFTYELCWKFMKRWLKHNYSESFTSGITRKQLFRYAAENLLITDFEAWVKYHELRNQTSHTYDSKVAEEIFKVAGKFLQDAKAFLQAIEVRND